MDFFKWKTWKKNHKTQVFKVERTGLPKIKVIYLQYKIH